ncbi:sulfatase-like hydrolase/transferase [bacterium]|nr:sulfatase-like hydrolase/transferase [bacterium]
MLNKLPLLIRLAAVYSLIGLSIGAFQGCILWLVSRLRKKDSGGRASVPAGYEERNLSLMHFSVAMGIGCFLNLLLPIFPRYLQRSSLLFQIFGCGVMILGSVLLAIALYTVGKRLLQHFPPKQDQKRFVFSKGAILLALVACLQAVWIPNFKSRQEKQTEVLVQKDNLANHANVILISVDSLRADHLSCYGYRRETSPNVDSLAREGTLFTRALSVTSWTLPAHLSMLTSLAPEALGVVGTHDQLDPQRITLAEILRKNGYATAGFVSAPFLYSDFGYNQGFDHYDDFTVKFDAKNIREANKIAHRGITSPALTAAIHKWLSNNHERKFFLFLHYWDVHYDYSPPPPFDKMFDPKYNGTINGRNFHLNPKIKTGMKQRDLAHILALYDGEIAYTDFHIGELITTLKRLNVFDDSLIIFTADHGDEFLEHGGKGHRRTLYDEVLRVPLIIKFPSGAEFAKGKVVDTPASILDIMPTILKYLGLKVPIESDGDELLSALNGHRTNSNRSLFASLRYDLYAVQSGNTKFIANLESFQKELYDLTNDPQEQNNLLHEGNQNKIEEHQRILLNWLNKERQKYRSLPRNQMDTFEMSEEMKEQLRSLGYIQ